MGYAEGQVGKRCETSAQGSRHGAQLEDALSALNMGAKEVSDGDGKVIDDDLCEVLHNLDIIPGKPPSLAVLEVEKQWTTFEEIPEVAEALLRDHHDQILDSVDKTQDGNESGDSEVDVESLELEADQKKELRVPPLYTQVSEQIAHLEEMAAACGIERAQEGIRMVTMAFLRAHAEKPPKQADLRMFLSSDN